jgi:hypothetical protein
VGVQAEDGAPEEGARPLLHDADAEVAVLDRTGELAVLERGAHDAVLTRRHLTAEDEGLGAAADPRDDGPDEDVVRAGLPEPHRPDLAGSRCAEPEGTGRVGGGLHRAGLSAWVVGGVLKVGNGVHGWSSAGLKLPVRQPAFPMASPSMDRSLLTSLL